MTKSVRRFLIAVCGVTSALMISTGVCALTSLNNNGLTASAQESVPAVSADENAILWSFNGSEKQGSHTVEFNSVNRLPFVIASLGGTEISSNDITVTDKNGDTVTEAINAGTYTFTYTGEAQDATNTVFTLEIAKKEINIGEFDNLAWKFNSRNYLQSGRVYRYSYKPSNDDHIQYYYSATEIASSPNSDWSDWKLETSKDVNYSIVGYDGSIAERSIHLNKDQEVYNNFYTADYAPEGFADYTNTASKDGKYEAIAVLTPMPNYTLVNRAGSAMSINDRGVSITINDGIATVTKTWYIAYYTNVFLDISSKGGDEEPYSIPSWTFGEFDAAKVRTPLLQHGDEMRDDAKAELSDGYEVSIEGEEGESIAIFNSSNNNQWVTTPKYDGFEDDTVKFTIKLGETVICEKQPRLLWSLYINKYTPVGQYTVIFEAVTIRLGVHMHWWTGFESQTCNSEYGGIIQAYTFEVRSGTLSIDDSAFNAAVNPDLKSYEVDFRDFAKDSSVLFDVISDKVSYPDFVVTSADAAMYGRYWAEHSEEYYDEAPVLLFRIARMITNDYFTADNEKWQTLITTPGGYTVFYTVTMKNYGYYPEVADRENHYFSAILYEEVEIPSLIRSEFVYSGEECIATVETDTRYTLSERVQTVVGEYKAKLTLTDPSVYRWKGGGDENDPAVVWLDFKINKYPVLIPSVDSRDYNGKAQNPQVSISYMDGKPLYRVITAAGFENGYTEASTYFIQLCLNDSHNYKWVNADGNDAAGVTDDGKIQIPFTINKLQNEWVRNVSVTNWEWQKFFPQVNTFTATCFAGVPIVYYVTSDADGASVVSGLNRFTVTDGVVSDGIAQILNGLPAGSYYLWGKVDATQNYTALTPRSYEFRVVKAYNGWVTEPAIVPWTDGASPNLPTGEALYGKVEFEIVSVTDSGEKVYSTTRTPVNALATAEAGEYILTAWVDESTNYAGLAKVTDSFRIYPPSSSSEKWKIIPSIENWVEGETPSEPVGEAAVDGVEVVFTYRTAGGQDLGMKPSTAGDYVLIATAYVNGENGESTILDTYPCPFKILPKALLVNEWVTMPTIANWSESGNASTPSGVAMTGDVTFSYKTANGKLLDGKPVEAGNYLLVAKVEAEGYETLVMEVPFAITAQQGTDSGLIAIMAVLGVAVVVLSATVAVVLVRSKNKKKDN